MKKLMKILCLMLSVMLLACVFTGCNEDGGNGGNGGQVSDEAWQQLLTMPSETIKSSTSVIEDGYTYDQTQATEYGKWYYSKLIGKTDLENKIMYNYSYYKGYVPEDEREQGDSEFLIVVSESYTFSYSDKYYEVSQQMVFGDNNKPEWHWRKEELTKATFIENFDVSRSSVELFYNTMQIYSNPTFKSMFRFNENTKEYEILQAGTMSMSIKFLSNGIQTTNQFTSLDKTVQSIVDVNKTVINIPDEVLGVVTANKNA